VRRPDNWLFCLIGAGLGAILVQVRLHLRDQADRKFARHVFDQTRSTDALDGHTRVIKERKPSVIIRRSATAEANPDPADPPDQQAVGEKS
jgi:hypothetical protein